MNSGLCPPGGLLRFSLDAKLMILLLVEEWLARAEGPSPEGPGILPEGPLLKPLGG